MPASAPAESPASSPVSTLRRRRSARDRIVECIWAATDTALVIAAAFCASLLRYDLDIDNLAFSSVLRFAVVAALIHLVLGFVVGSYRIDHLRGSFEETVSIGQTAVLTAAILTPLVLLTHWFPQVPRSLALMVPAFALIGMFTVRFIVRSYRWGRAASTDGVEKVIIFGAGQGGRRLVRALRRDDDSRYAPVAILDDDPRKRRLKIDGVSVKGDRAALLTVAARSGATSLVIAVSSASADLIRTLREDAKRAGLGVLILPSLNEMFGHQPQHVDLRQLNMEDLLGRRPVDLDETAIATSISGKTVLVTGAGGSIGSELARQISRFGPKRLILLDRDESALHGTQMSLTGRALLDDGTLALVDIRDLDALRSLFTVERPEMVFHAAALKHLTLLEQFPLEAWKTNVIGTLNVLQAAHEIGVETFVNISTDKAANPSCVLGYSKRVAERLTADFAVRSAGRYVSVRFGNVLGSRGSVVTAFTAQIERGGPITVTHPEVERYFMLIPEASQLVLQASAIGHDGEVMVLEMGEPVKIIDVARTLIELSGKANIDIVFTGLRAGEKLSEELFAPDETPRRSSHELVDCVSVPPLASVDTFPVRFHENQSAYEWMRAQGTRNPDRIHSEQT